MSASDTEVEQEEDAFGFVDQRSLVEQAVIENPGLTSYELSYVCGGLDRYQVARRLPELEKRGRVERGLKRLDETMAESITWWPVKD